MLNLIKILLAITLIVFITIFCFNLVMMEEKKPAPKIETLETKEIQSVGVVKVEIIDNNERIKNVKPGATNKRVVTCYNAGDPNQCSGDPCISANGENICLAISLGYKRCAANFVSLGTHIQVEGYGLCLVVDRTAERYGERVDIAYPLGKDCMEWGRRTVDVTVME